MDNKKKRFEQIEIAFDNMQKNKNYIQSLSIIESHLSVLLDTKVQVKIIASRQSDPFYIMSVFPEESIIDRLVNNIVDEEKEDVIKDIFASNQLWIIEIDSRIITDNAFQLTPKELTALLLHEVGHIALENTIINRIRTILKLQFARSSLGTKNILRDHFYKALVKIPIANEFVLDGERSKLARKSLDKREKQADNYAVKAGYRDELISALDKIINASSVQSKRRSLTSSDPLVASYSFTVKTVDNLKNRKEAIVVNDMSRLFQSTSSPTLKSLLNQIRFNITKKPFTESALTNVWDTDNRALYLYNQAYNEVIEEGVFSGIFKKKLKPLDWDAIDYIRIKNNNIYSNSDKLLLASYASTKLSTAEYYLDIIEKDPESKSYIVPHNKADVIRYIDEMKKVKSEVVNKPFDRRWKIYIDKSELVDF